MVVRVLPISFARGWARSLLGFSVYFAIMSDHVGEQVYVSRFKR